MHQLGEPFTLGTKPVDILQILGEDRADPLRITEGESGFPVPVLIDLLTELTERLQVAVNGLLGDLAALGKLASAAAAERQDAVHLLTASEDLDVRVLRHPLMLGRWTLDVNGWTQDVHRLREKDPDSKEIPADAQGLFCPSPTASAWLPITAR